MRGITPTGDREAATRIARIAVPAGLAVYTWLALLVVAGILLRLGSLSLLNVLPVFVAVLLFLPLVEFAPWREGVADRLRRWAGGRRTAFLATAALLAVAASPVVIDAMRPLVTLLRLAHRNGAGFLYGVFVFYRAHLGETFARVVFRFGRWYLELLWLYLLGTGVAAVHRRFRGER